MLLKSIDFLNRMLVVALAVVVAFGPASVAAPTTLNITSPSEEDEQETPKVASLAVRVRHLAQHQPRATQCPPIRPRTALDSISKTDRRIVVASFSDLQIVPLRC